MENVFKNTIHNLRYGLVILSTLLQNELWHNVRLHKQSKRFLDKISEPL